MAGQSAFRRSLVGRATVIASLSGMPRDLVVPLEALEKRYISRSADLTVTLNTQTGQMWRGRRSDHEHRRARLSRHAFALLPRADGGEAACPRRDRHAPARSRREAKRGNRTPAARCAGF